VAGSRPGMQFVLCSDGINKEMSDAEIDAECGRQLAPSELAARLMALATSRAARDNISAVTVRLQD
jgi:protein phosphatase